MATRQSGGMGIAHLTVVPEDPEREPSTDDGTDEERTGNADGEA